jgi:arylsulfatase A-like enzyme
MNGFFCALEATLAAALGWAVLEAALSGAMGALPGLLVYHLPAAILAAGLAALPVTRRLTPRSPRAALITSATLIAVGAAAYWVARATFAKDYDLPHEIAVSAAAAGVAIAALLAGLVAGTRAASPSRLVRLPFLVVAAALGWSASQATPALLGQEWAVALASAGALAALGAARVPASPPPRRPVALLLGLATLALCTAWVTLDARVRVDTARPLAGRAWSRLLTRLTDGDGDGVSGWLGHPDCDDTRAEVAPGVRDVPANGVDDNCAAGDPRPDEILPLWRPGGVRGQAPEPHSFPRGRHSVVLITLDAARADHLSLYGYGRPTTPHLDRLAERALVFEAAQSPSNFTALSLYSLHTGLYPTSFVHQGELVALPGMTLAETLRAAGWATGAVVDFRRPLPYLLAGFERQDLREPGTGGDTDFESSAGWVTAHARFALSDLQARQPFFLWAHYSDPHAAYVAHPGFDFGDSAIDCYDSELGFADAQIGELLTALEGVPDTLVVVTSDHGEAFGEHGLHTHGQGLYEEEVRVPLLVALPPGTGGRPFQARVAQPVDLTDLVPTIHDALGLATPRPRPGESLLAHALGGAPLRTPEAVSQTLLPYARLTAVRRGSDKWILDHLRGAALHFNLSSDPGEQSPEVTELEEAQDLLRWLDLHLAMPGLM